MRFAPSFLGRLLVLAWLSTAALRAHDAGLSVANLQVHPAGLELNVSYAMADVRRLLPPYSLPADAGASPESLRAAHLCLDPLAARIWEIRSGETVLMPLDVSVEFIAGDNLAFRARYPRPGSGAITGRSLNLERLLSTHRELVKCTDAQGRTIFEGALTRDRPAVQIPLAAAAANAATGRTAPKFGAFFRLGVVHIWTGYDHLLFLFALLVVARSFRSVVVIISCFTLAHSITLGAATLGWVRLPPSVVEPLIAASIVLVGIENLRLRGAEPKRRGWLTFGFGLVHGFGFATVLQDLGVGARGTGIGVPLFSFNLGVEAGQMCVAALLLPVLFALFRSEPVRLRSGTALSVLVCAAGLYWLAERTLFA